MGALWQLLIEHGANIEAVEYRGLTPLHGAAHQGTTEVAKVNTDCIQ